jgi:hypothetical protein
MQGPEGAAARIDGLPQHADDRMATHDSVLELVGDTPIIRARHLDVGPCTLYLKLESQNPGGSIKDRIGLSMIEAAEKRGDIQPGGTLVEGHCRQYRHRPGPGRAAEGLQAGPGRAGQDERARRSSTSRRWARRSC